MTTAYCVSGERSIDMPNIDAELILQLTEDHLPEGYAEDEELRDIFELGCLMNVVILERLSQTAFMSFFRASRNVFEFYLSRGPKDDGKIKGWFERVCEEWEELLKLMETDPRFC